MTYKSTSSRLYLWIIYTRGCWEAWRCISWVCRCFSAMQVCSARRCCAGQVDDDCWHPAMEQFSSATPQRIEMEVIWRGTRQSSCLSWVRQVKYSIYPVAHSNYAATEVKNLGVYIDDLQLNSYSRNISGWWRQTVCQDSLVSSTPKYTSTAALFRRRNFVVRTFILSRLDCCNSLYAGCTSLMLWRLQRVQDAAARLLCREPPLAHAGPLLKQLNWLPVSSLTQFNPCTRFTSITVTMPSCITCRTL